MTPTPTSTEDQHIVDTADKWKDRELVEGKLRHDRAMKALKWCVLACTLVGVLAVTCTPLSNTYNSWRDRAAVENKLADEQAAKEARHIWTEQEAIKAGNVNRKAEREVAWETCIRTQSLDACQAIEERAYQACWFGNHNGDIFPCVNKRLNSE